MEVPRALRQKVRREELRGGRGFATAVPPQGQLRRTKPEPARNRSPANEKRTRHAARQRKRRRRTGNPGGTAVQAATTLRSRSADRPPPRHRRPRPDWKRSGARAGASEQKQSPPHSPGRRGRVPPPPRAMARLPEEPVSEPRRFRAELRRATTHSNGFSTHLPPSRIRPFHNILRSRRKNKWTFPTLPGQEVDIRDEIPLPACCSRFSRRSQSPGVSIAPALPDQCNVNRRNISRGSRRSFRPCGRRCSCRRCRPSRCRRFQTCPAAD